MSSKKRPSSWPILALVLALVLFAAGATAAPAASSPAPVAPVNVTAGIGIKGYDAVAYFISGKPTPGVERFAYAWKGVTYRFASAQNLERFKADPEKYLPQYGGYCAYAMSVNRIADIDPARWAIVEGKLYLNNNRISYGLWALDKSGNIVAGDHNWVAFPKTTESAATDGTAR